MSDRVDSEAIDSAFVPGSSLGSDKQGYSVDSASNVCFSKSTTFLVFSLGVM